MTSRDGDRIGGNGSLMTCGWIRVFALLMRALPLLLRVRRVELVIEPGQSLGLMIRGGIEYGLGIYVTGVDKDSVADRAGLNVRASSHEGDKRVALVSSRLNFLFVSSSPRRSAIKSSKSTDNHS
jgi:hypothetical protein